MTPTEGTILNLTPAAGTVEFTTKGESWTLPLIGWAVVVTYLGDEEEGAGLEYETSVHPVILAEDQYPETVPTFLSSLEGSATVKVIPR